MRFQVPQFIEVEDKIFGPLTFKQFIYLAGAGGVVIASFSFLPKFFAFLISAPVAILGLALAFYKVNNRPFILIVESFFKYFSKERLYIWKKEDRQPTKSGDRDQSINPMVYIPKLSNSKLKDLSWQLGVKNTGTQSDEDEGGR